MEVPFTTKSPGIGGKIKRRYSDFIVEEISEEHNSKVEYFAKADVENITRKMFPKINKIPENPENKEQLILELEKFNTDTYNAIKKISRFLRFSHKRIGYAGIKDKRAITSQRISIFKPDIERLKKFRDKFLYLKPLKWSNKRIKLGDLKKNKFKIIIREIDLEKKEIEKRIQKIFKEIKEKGIANFFGEQRFGGIRKVTHLVGKEIIKGNLKKAMFLYLTYPSEREEEEIKKARKNLAKTKNFVQAIKEFPTKFTYERSMLHHLCKYPKDFAGAFQKLPKKLRIIFTHAYQSYLFNEVIKERLKEGISLDPVEGDVLLDKIATAPLFGFETKLSEGKIQKIEKKVLRKERISLKDFKVKKISEMSSKGTRKKIKLIPEKLKLIEVSNDEFNEGKKKAIISFELTKGNYATTVLREIMKVQNSY